VKDRQNKAATIIQAHMRSTLMRYQYAEELAGIQLRRLRGRLAARQYVAEIVRREYEGPILHRRLLKRLAEPSSLEALVLGLGGNAEGGDVPATSSLAAVLNVQRQRVARAHAAAINRMLCAAPEAESIGAPLSLLRLLALVDVSVTGTLMVNECQFGALRLPNDVQVCRSNINKQSREVKVRSHGVGHGLDPGQRMLKGDTLTLRGRPHRLATVLEVKNKKLVLIVPAAGGAAASGGAATDAASGSKAAQDAALAKTQDLLLTSANRLARWLQSLVRIRIAQREAARRAHAALAIQLAYASLMARRKLQVMEESAELAISHGKSFVRRKARRSSKDRRSGGVLGSTTGTAGPNSDAIPHKDGAAWRKVKMRHAVKSQLGDVVKAKQKKKPSQANTSTKSRGKKADGGRRDGAARGRAV